MRFTPIVSRLAVVLTLGAAVLVACADGNGSVPTTAAPGPITVAQLVARSADTPVRVSGLLHASGGITRLCDAILESYPPQCGEPSVELVGLDLATVAGTTTAEGVTWKEGALLTLRRAADDRFLVIGSEQGAGTSVVLGIFSGVEDPAWTLTAQQASDLSAALARLTRVSGPAPEGGLGYHGFTITAPDVTLVAFAGMVASVDAEPAFFLDDSQRTIERLLLDSARPHVAASIFTEVQRALDAG